MSDVLFWVAAYVIAWVDVQAFTEKAVVRWNSTMDEDPGKVFLLFWGYQPSMSLNKLAILGQMGSILLLTIW